MIIPQEAIEAAAQSIYETSWYGYVFLRWGEIAEANKIFYRQRAAACLAEVLPAIEKQVRAEVAAEIRASLPRDLAASAQDPGGWFSGMTGDLNIVVEVDEDMTPFGYSFELEAATGTIDLHHLADIAARIAEEGATVAPREVTGAQATSSLRS